MGYGKMNQRTCSHRVSELYSEVILTGRFKEEFTNQESFYYNNFHVTIFRNSNFKSKLLIVDKESQNIVFENIFGSSFILFNDLKNDKFLYSIDIEYSMINKITNPTIANGLSEEVISKKHLFLHLSKRINDVSLKDDILYFSININGAIIKEDRTIKIELKNNYPTPIDELSSDFSFTEISSLIGVDIESLNEINRDNFDFGITASSVNFNDKTLNRKNSILIQVYNCHFMEEVAYFIDYSQGVTKQLHPPYLIETCKNYILIKPSYAYNTYSDFKLIRLSDLNEFDLYKVVNPEVLGITQEDVYKYSIGDFEVIEFQNDDVLLLDNFEFSCQNLFSGNITSNLKSKKSSSIKSLIPLKGSFFDGYALELHTIKSTLKADGSFETLRTELGELIYKLKYNFDKSSIEPLAQRCANIIKNIFPNIDVIIPAPPSNLNRPFQPVYEIAKRISELTKIPVDFDFIKKLPTEQIKTLSDQEARNIILERAISIKDRRYKGRNILLFDDLFRSGDTLNAIAKKLRNDGEVNNIKALCVTKTRVKK